MSTLTPISWWSSNGMRMCVCVCVWVCECVCVYMHACYVNVCVRACSIVCVCACMCDCVCVHASLHVWLCVCVHACVTVCMCVCVCVHMCGQKELEVCTMMVYSHISSFRTIPVYTVIQTNTHTHMHPQTTWGQWAETSHSSKQLIFY